MPIFLSFSVFIFSLCILSNSAYAAAFALKEQSVSKLGNAYAGSGSEASDPTVMFFNPAGITRLEGNQAAVAGYLVNVDVEFTNGSNTNVTGASTDEPGGVFLVPNLYAVYDLESDFKLGFSVNTPFGFETEYNDDFVGRFQGLDSMLQTVSLGPTLAYKASEQWSFGLSVFVQRLDVRLTQATPLSGLGAFQDGQAVLEGSSVAPHFTLGFMYEPTDETRLGFSYRSEVQHDVDGFARFINPTGAPAGVFLNTDLTATAKLPESALFSVYHEIDDRWAVMADVEWTRWSRLQDLVVDFENTNQPNQSLEFKFSNSFFYALGVNYAADDSWLLRAGVAHDQSPADTQTRVVRVPDSDRTWLAVGATYTGFENWALDLGYTHIMVEDAKINRQNPSGTDFVSGEYESSIDILGVQATFGF
jgi:long-chain fatty acid transport protein